METNVKEYINRERIEFSLANTPQITFEVTDTCNLKCTYCGYGKFYSDYDNREDKMLPVEKAFALLNYINQLLESSQNVSYNRNIFVSFYGGEPLLNMDFIRKIVSHVENIDCKTRTFSYAMTTNALLLHKYMDFLVEKDFHLLISLDGNRENTEYRVDNGGKPAFDRIVKNVDLIRKKYPDYFEKRVNFNSVLHNKNSVETIYQFFKEKYNKMPRIGELNNSGIRPDKIDEFEKAYRNSEESLNQSEHYTEIVKNMALQLGSYRSSAIYLMQYSDFVYKDYNELLYGKPSLENIIPTGTCLPFSKKIFVTVNGKLLPCERIGHQFALGMITDKGVELNFDLIANKYNTYYSKVDKQCKSCQNRRTCMQCIYNLPNIDSNPHCEGYMTKKEFEVYQNTQLRFFAENPNEYFHLMKDVINV
jgi:uncharacterized protein